jgi:hypothetical protein
MALTTQSCIFQSRAHPPSCDGFTLRLRSTIRSYLLGGTMAATDKSLIGSPQYGFSVLRPLNISSTY